MKPTNVQKLARTRLSDQAAAEIKRLIVAGAYPPGKRLPTEKDLASELGVTRLTVREALFQLESAGFTTTLHGSGTCVADLHEPTSFRLLGDMIAAGRKLSPGEAVAVMEFRAVVVGGFADAIGANATAAHLSALHEVLQDATAATGDPERLARADYRFNELLALASGNTFFVMLIRSLRGVHEHLGAVIFRSFRDHAAILATQAAITKAVEQRRASKLRRALEIYLGGGTEIVRKWASAKGK